MSITVPRGHRGAVVPNRSGNYAPGTSQEQTTTETQQRHGGGISRRFLLGAGGAGLLGIGLGGWSWLRGRGGETRSRAEIDAAMTEAMRSAMTTAGQDVAAAYTRREVTGRSFTGIARLDQIAQGEG